MKYESTILNRLIDTYGVVGNPCYISEIIKEFIVRGKEQYPNLFTYQSDWLAHIDVFGLNPSYTVSYTGQSIYAPNTLERPVKSAILKGQTLVNLAKVRSATSYNICSEKNIAIKPNTKYIALFNPTYYEDENEANYALLLVSSVSLNDSVVSGDVAYTNSIRGGLGSEYKPVKGDRYLIFTSKANETYLHIRTGGNNGILYTDMIILEYQEGMENWDIPYFEGMQSVKMPVLTTTGKNFMNSEMEIGILNSNDGSLQDSSAWQRSTNFITLKSNTQYQLNDTTRGKWFLFYDKNKNFIGSIFKRNGQFTTPHNCAFIKFTIETNDLSNKWQIELGDTITEYEPYKSNILSTPSDLVLGGIGDVQDTLDLLTGDVVNSFDEIIFNGSENWSLSGIGSLDTSVWSRFSTVISNMKETTLNIVCDNIPKGQYNQPIFGWDTGSGKRFIVQIENSKLVSSDIAGFKHWISQNPIKVRYELSEKVHKTVDLTILDQNNQNVKQLMSFNGGTHFNTSSSEGSPLPSVSVSVETDLEETLMMCSLEGYTM